MVRCRQFIVLLSDLWVYSVSLYWFIAQWKNPMWIKASLSRCCEIFCHCSSAFPTYSFSSPPPFHHNISTGVSYGPLCAVIHLIKMILIRCIVLSGSAVCPSKIIPGSDVWLSAIVTTQHLSRGTASYGKAVIMSLVRGWAGRDRDDYINQLRYLISCPHPYDYCTILLVDYMRF